MKSFCLSGWIAALLLLSGTLAGRGAADVEVKSPNGAIHFKLLLQEPQLKYEVTFKGKPVIERSPLTLTLDGVELTREVTPGNLNRRKIDESYPWRGSHSRATNRCNEAALSLEHRKSRTAYVLEVRAFNDGVAFRHIIPGKAPARVPDEASTFTIPEGSTVWYHDLGGHYEATHDRKNVRDITNGQWLAPPVTFKLPGSLGYASLTEAALFNYSGMALQAEGERKFRVALGDQHPVSYPYRLRYSNDIGRVSKPAAVAGTITSPWRVVMIGADLNALVNSDIVHNLCPPPDAGLFPRGLNTDWIKPGRAVWKYLDGGPSTFEGMRDFSRWAGELGFEYHVIEGFWSRWSDEQIKELVDYSRERGVGLWFWRHSRELRTPEAREQFFGKLERAGVVGAKIDFFDHEHKELIDLYETLLRDAARHRIMINFHGANKPTGEARPWPNELVREGVRGMESSRLLARARHNTTLPFTRYLAGHGDYTPVHFGARRGDTTWTHQIATAAIFDEPLLTYAAHPTNILNHPALAMIKSIPAVWDETIVLPPSEIEEMAAFARRSGGQWFLAVVNGPAARKARIPLSFLDRGDYHALVVNDDQSAPDAVQIDNTIARRIDFITLDLVAGGGFIARFSRN
jgi:alpha-glucosidase